jgi:phage pi2 protein 07
MLLSISRTIQIRPQQNSGWSMMDLRLKVRTLLIPTEAGILTPPKLYEDLSKAKKAEEAKRKKVCDTRVTTTT